MPRSLLDASSWQELKLRNLLVRSLFQELFEQLDLGRHFFNRLSRGIIGRVSQCRDFGAQFLFRGMA